MDTWMVFLAHKLLSCFRIKHVLNASLYLLCFRSNSCMSALTQALPRFHFTAAVYTGRPALSVAWPETRTVPGMELPVLATCQTQRGL